jgi:hypothetical protein
VDRDVSSRLQHLDTDFEHFGESCKDVISQDHLGNGFGGSGQLVGDIEEPGKIDADWFSGNRAQLTEFSEECQTANFGVCCVHMLF